MKNDFEKFLLSKNPYSRSVYDDYQKKISGHINPYILEEREMHVTQMDVFSRLMRDRIIFFGTEVTSDVCNIVNAQLLWLDNSEPGVDIQMMINSPGGSVYDGLGVVDTMNYISSDVSTTVTGLAASMGSILLVSGTKGKRFSLPHSRVLLHQPMGGVGPHTQASDIEIECKEINNLKKELYEIISNGTGQDYEKVWKDCDRDYWLTAKESLDYGLIDEIIVNKK